MSDEQLQGLHRAYRRYLKQAARIAQVSAPARLHSSGVRSDAGGGAATLAGPHRCSRALRRPAASRLCSPVLHPQERQHLQHQLAELRRAVDASTADAASGGGKLCGQAGARQLLEVVGARAKEGVGRSGAHVRIYVCADAARRASLPQLTSPSLPSCPRRPAPMQLLDAVQGLNALANQEYEERIDLCMAWANVSSRQRRRRPPPARPARPPPPPHPPPTPPRPRLPALEHGIYAVQSERAQDARVRRTEGWMAVQSS